jgi:prepilin-type N-terminal cleavage/methylation domain-containing protein
MFKRLFKQFHRGQKGFTLIELLVVVAILGVLAAVAIPNLGRFVSSGEVSAANSELATAQTAAAAYMAEGGYIVDNAPSAFTQDQLTDYVDIKGFKGTYNFLANGNLDESEGNTPSYPGNVHYVITDDEGNPVHQFQAGVE